MKDNNHFTSFTPFWINLVPSQGEETWYKCHGPYAVSVLSGSVIDNPFVTVKVFTCCPICDNSFINPNGSVCNCEEPEELALELFSGY